MKKLSIFWKYLLVLGWLVFWLSLFMPMNTSRGGLTDAGRSNAGFINLFYSIGSVFILPTLILDHKDMSFVPEIILTAGVGICNILMIFAVPFLIYSNRIKNFAKYIAIGCAVYVCTVGTIANRHFYPIRYGHYIWCLAFVIVAIALGIKAEKQNVLS